MPRSMLQICTYNPLTASTRQGCRLEEILVTLQANQRDLVDWHQTAAGSFISCDSRCACRIQTVLSGALGWVEGQIGLQVSWWQSSWAFVNSGKSVKRPLHKLVCKGEEGHKDQNGEAGLSADGALPSTAWRLGDRPACRFD